VLTGTASSFSSPSPPPIPPPPHPLKYPDLFWSLPSLLLSQYQGSFVGVKQPGCEVHHPYPCNAKVQMNRAAPLLLPLCSMYGNRFTHIFISFQVLSVWWG